MIDNDIKKFLINETMTVTDAMKLMSDLGCKILYIHDDLKLKATLTDGDIRRYLLKNGSLDNVVKYVANYSPKYLVNASYKDAQEFMSDNLIDSVPSVDENYRILNVYFTNYRYKAKHFDKISLPVVMMAGGKGTRLYPYTKVLPKPLIPVGDVPIAERIINGFCNEGCNKFYLIVNHMKNMIKSYFNEIDKNYTVEFIDEDEPLGTGGGIYYLKGIINEPFILTNCDILIKEDFSKVFKYHKESKNVITMVVAEQSMQVPYGVVEFNDKMNITSMKEKPTFSYYTNTGCYIVEPSVIDEIDEKKSFGFPDLINKCMNKKMNVGVYSISEDSFIDMGELDKLNNANKVII